MTIYFAFFTHLLKYESQFHNQIQVNISKQPAFWTLMLMVLSIDKYCLKKRLLQF